MVQAVKQRLAVRTGVCTFHLLAIGNGALLKGQAVGSDGNSIIFGISNLPTAGRSTIVNNYSNTSIFVSGKSLLNSVYCTIYVATGFEAKPVSGVNLIVTVPESEVTIPLASSKVQSITSAV